MNKIVKYLLTVVLAGSVVCSSNAVLYATEVNEITNDVVVDGVEEMYVAPFDTMINKSDYKEDILFGRCEDYQKIIMKKGDYCITFPEDAHKPSCGHGNHLTKICVKIPS